MRTLLGSFALAVASLAGSSGSGPQAQERSPTRVVESISGRSRLECTESRLAESRVGRYAFFRGTGKVWERELPIVLHRLVLKDDGSFEGVGLRGGLEENPDLVLAAVDPAGAVIERRVIAQVPPEPGFPLVRTWGDVAYSTAEDLVVHAVRDRVDDRLVHRLFRYRWGRRELESEAVIRMCSDPEGRRVEEPVHSLVSLRCTEDGRSVFALWEVPQPGAIDSGLIEDMGNVVSVFDRSGTPLGCLAMGYGLKCLSTAGCRLDGAWPEYAWATWATPSSPGTLRVNPTGAETQLALRIAVDRGENGEARVRVAKRQHETVQTVVAVSPTGRSRLECFPTTVWMGPPSHVGRYTFLRGAEQIWERDLRIVLERFVVKDDGSFEGVGKKVVDGKTFLVLAGVDASGVVTERRVEETRIRGAHMGSTPSWSDVTYCASEDVVIHALRFTVDDLPQHRLVTYRWGRAEPEAEIVIRTCLDAPDPRMQPYGRIESLRCTEDGRSILVLWSVRSSGSVPSQFGEPPRGAGNVLSVFDRSGRALACFAMGDAIRRLSDAGCRLDARWIEYAYASWAAFPERDGSLRAILASSSLPQEFRLVVDRTEGGEASVRRIEDQKDR